MTGYVRKDTTNNIADGNVINAADLDAEFDGVQDAFNASTGHNHDGTTGEGAPITALGPTQDVTISAILLAPKTTNTVDIGSSALKFKDLFLAGNGSIGGTLAVTGVATFTAQPILSSLTASRAVFSDGSKGLVSNAITGTGNVVMSASPTLTGTIDAAAATLSGNLTLSGGTANGVAYLNGSKVVTSGSALTFDGSTFYANSNLSLSGAGTGARYLALLNETNTYAGTLNIQAGGGSSAFGGGVTLYGHSHATYPGAVWIGKSSGTSTGILFGNGGNGVGDEYMRLTSTGLGIGTSSPATKIDARLSGTSSGTVINVGNTGTGIFGGIGVSDGGAYPVQMWGSSLTFLTGSSTYGSTTEKMRLDSSGNLGLGVTPSAWSGIKAMQIGTAASFSGGSSFNDAFIASNAFYDGSNWKYINSNPAYYSSIGGSAAARWYNAPSGTAGNAITFTQAMTLDANAQLQIGTTTASGKVTIDNTGASTPLIYAKSADQAGARIALSNTGTSGQTWQIVAGDVGVSNSGLSFYDGTATRVRIDSSGNLLVGTTSTISAFNNKYRQVINPVVNASAQYGLMVNANANAYTQYAVVFADTYSEQIVGSITFTTSATAYNTSSDYRLKNDIAPMTNALAKVALLKPVTYQWKVDGSNGEGFIAHELAEVVPQCVTGEKDAVDEEGNPQYQGIDTSFLVATLTAALQELNAKFDAYVASHP